MQPGHQCISAELEDNNLGFRVRVAHDGEFVTSITGDALRTPLSTCPAALSRLQRLVGADALGSDNEPAIAHQNGNVCYSYSPEVVQQAVYLPNSVRDFTATPELLLRFI